MLNENTLELLKTSTKEIDNLCAQLSSNILSDIEIDEAKSVDVVGAIDDCLKKVKKLVASAHRQSGVTSEITYSFALICLDKKDNKVAVSALKTLSKRGNITAQVKLGEVSCRGLKSKLGRVEYKDVDYGVSILRYRVKNNDFEAAYQLGQHHKRECDFEEAVFYFEKSYELGNQKVYPELLLLYKRKLTDSISYDEKLRVSQKISNIKSELRMN